MLNYNANLKDKARQLRFNSREVLKESDAVVEAIYRMIADQLNAGIPPGPPLKKGGMKEKNI